MDVKIQSVKFDADRKLLDFVEDKVSKLDRFYDYIVSADVILSLDKDNEHGNKIAVLKLAVAGDDLIAERKSKSFEESIDLCVDALRKQIEKHKSKFK